MPKLRLTAQPRIPGVKRLPRSTSLAPNLHKVLGKLIASEGKFGSGIVAEIFGNVVGIDAATNEPLSETEHRRRFREMRAAFLPEE